MKLALPEGKYGRGGALARFTDQIEEQRSVVPGVCAAAVTHTLPLQMVLTLHDRRPLCARNLDRCGHRQCQLSTDHGGVFRGPGDSRAARPRVRSSGPTRVNARRDYQRGRGSEVLARSESAPSAQHDGFARRIGSRRPGAPRDQLGSSRTSEILASVLIRHLSCTCRFPS